MSIEIGRGIKRGARGYDDDGSSNIIFSMGDGSLYELTGTPPLKQRDSQDDRRTQFARQTSTRRVTSTANTKDAINRMGSVKQTSLAAALKKFTADE